MTIQEVFNQMTAREVARFCKNVVKERKDVEEFFVDEFDDMYKWIASSFVWSETREGHDYWEAIACRTTTNTIEVNGVKYWTLA